MGTGLRWADGAVIDPPRPSFAVRAVGAVGAVAMPEGRAPPGMYLDESASGTGVVCRLGPIIAPGDDPVAGTETARDSTGLRAVDDVPPAPARGAGADRAGEGDP